MRAKLPIEERFWRHVTKTDGCWEWKSARIESRGGYGIFQLGRGIGTRGAHVVSYELAFGSTEGRWVLHRCDNPPCVRPDHLFLGDARDNARDMKAKGRSSNQKKTHCKAGHEFNEQNTWVDGRGYRQCRICRRPRRRVTHTEETLADARRRMGAPRAAITHCPQGHPYDEQNTSHRAGRRHCRACQRARYHNAKNSSGMPTKGDAAL